MKFNGTIIITDPCYVSKKEDWGTVFNYSNGDVEISDINFKNYFTEPTGYGDGRITIFDQDSEKFLGTFTVDSGVYGIFYKENIECYNSDFFNEYIENENYVVIENFKGNIEVVWKKNELDVDYENYETYEEDYESSNYEEDEFIKTFEGIGNVNFIAKQW